MASQSSSSGGQRCVRIHLRDLQNREFLAERIILLESPLYEIRIGRGSQTDACLHPSESNAWFTSRVMSREHALLKADPVSKKIYLEDTASMHGTYLNNIRLEPNQSVVIRNDEKIQFGTQIVRGDQTYDPLELKMQATWEDRWTTSPPDLRITTSLMSKNSFSVDYSDEEDDDDIKFLHRQPRRYTVPESDDDESSDIEKQPAIDSAPSSPAEFNETDHKTAALLPSPQITHSTTTESTVELVTATPGSTLQNAFDLSDDEDQDNETRQHPVEELDTISIYSEDDEDFIDEEIDEESDRSSFNNTSDGEDEEIYDENCPPSNILETPASNENQNRAPSPSDAAMSKPAEPVMPRTPWLPHSSLPAIHNLVDPTQAQPLCGYDYSIIPGAQPSPSVSNFGFCNMGWSNNGSNPGYAHFYENDFTPSVTYPPPASQFVIQPPRPYQPPFHNRPMESSCKIDSPPMVAKPACQPKASKVSISDIIDEVHLDSLPTMGNRKRKADEISVTTPVEASNTTNIEQIDAMQTSGTIDTCEDVDEPVETAVSCSDLPAEVQTFPEVTPEKSTPSKKSVTFSPQAVIINPELERPRKKAKVEHAEQGNSFYKYLAATVAGATIGAVGTVFGLAALPADFFI